MSFAATEYLPGLPIAGRRVVVVEVALEGLGAAALGAAAPGAATLGAAVLLVEVRVVVAGAGEVRVADCLIGGRLIPLTEAPGRSADPTLAG